jgi:hypothetical protein
VEFFLPYVDQIQEIWTKTFETIVHMDAETMTVYKEVEHMGSFDTDVHMRLFTSMLSERLGEKKEKHIQATLKLLNTLCDTMEQMRSVDDAYDEMLESTKKTM